MKLHIESRRERRTIVEWIGDTLDQVIDFMVRGRAHPHLVNVSVIVAVAWLSLLAVAAVIVLVLEPR